MRTIPPCYYHPSILRLIDSYVRDDIKRYSDLEQYDKELITAQILEVLGEEAYDAIIQSDNLHSTIHHLKQYMVTGQKEYAFDLAETMSKNASVYYIDVMDLLFSERVDERMHDVNRENGFYPRRDSVTGEVCYY